LLVFAIRPTEIATIALAAMYFSIALRMLTTGQINIYHFAPAIGADWTVRIAYLSPSGARGALCLLFSLLSSGCSGALKSRHFVGNGGDGQRCDFCIACILYEIYHGICFRDIRRARLTYVDYQSLGLPEATAQQTYIFAGLAGLVCALHDAVVALRQSGDEMWIQYGVLTYALSMGVIYAQRVVQAIDEGNETKETLTRQVERRTRQLRDADKEREIAFKQMLIAKNEAEQANRAKSVFLANLSHEIRTPLNTIVGMSELLLDSPLTDEQRERIRVIRIGAEAQLTLINEILDFSKLAAHKLELDPHFCDLPQMLSDTVALIKPLVEKKHIGLMTEIASDLPRFVMCDANRLRQVLLNLLVNGVKFTNTGFVALRVDVQQRDEDAIQLLFSCVDTGIGLNTKDKENLFQPFQQADSSTTRKYGGTGLGLAISRQIVSLMGGELDVESEANFGARFFFSIRIGLASEKQVLATVTQNTGDAEPGRLFSHLRVLLVEDNEINMEIVQAMLQKLGLSADPAVNGQEAVEMAVTNRYDLILMDIQMPEMDGLAATKIIRSRRVTTRIVALTANTSETDQADYLAAGMNAFLPKPVTMRGLTQLLTNLTAQ
jgi:signal transduction histidine kinase